MDDLSEESFRKSSQLQLVFRTGAGDDQAGFFVEDAEVRLAVEIELAVDGLSADQAGKTDHPGTGFANARGHGQLPGVVREVRRNGCLRAAMVVERVLRQPAQIFVTDLAGVEKAR